MSLLVRAAAFSLSLVTGAALAGPITDLTAALGLTGGTTTGKTPATGNANLLKLENRPALGALSRANGRLFGALPGLGARHSLGITALQQGADGSGIGDVINLGPRNPIIADQLDGVLVTPLLGLDGNFGLLDIGLFEGNRTAFVGRNGLVSGALFSGSGTGLGGLAALGVRNGNNTGIADTLLGLATLSGNNAGNGPIGVGILNGNNTGIGPGLLGLAALSGNNAGNGPIGVGILNGNDTGIGPGLLGLAALSGNNAGNGPIGVGILNGNNTGNGRFLALAALSGARTARSSDGLGIGLLNADAILALRYAGEDVISTTGLRAALIERAAEMRGIDSYGIAIGNPTGVVKTKNPLLNVGLLSGANSASGGLLGVGVLAGNNSARAGLLGVCVLCGNNSGVGPLGVAVLSGRNSGLGNAVGQIPGLAGVGVLNADNSGNGGLLGAGVLNGANSGNGVIAAGILNRENSGNGRQIGVGVLNGANSGNGLALLGAGVLNGANSGNGGVIGAGVLNGADSGNGRTLAAGVLNGANSGNGRQVAAGVLNGDNSGNGGTVGAGVLNGANSGNGGQVGAGVLNGGGSGNGGTVGAGVLNTTKSAVSTAGTGTSGGLGIGLLNTNGAGSTAANLPNTTTPRDAGPNAICTVQVKDSTGVIQAVKTQCVTKQRKV